MDRSIQRFEFDSPRMIAARLIAVVLLFSFLLPFTDALGQTTYWPQWRGPDNNGVSTDTRVPTEWSTEKNVAWRVDLPGPAGATPVVWGSNLFLSSVDQDGNLLLICYSTDGEKRWEQKVGTGNRVARGDEGNSASPSPSTDGKHVWCMMCSGDLACYTVNGKLVWKKDLQKEYGRFSIQFGMTSTPVLDRGHLYLQLIHGPMQDRTSTSVGWLIALDAATGKEKWKHKRETEGTRENKHAYTSPVLYRDPEREYLLSHGADYLTAHSLKDGSEIWRCGGFQRERYNQFLRFVASPACVPGLIVAPSAKNGPVLALKPDLKGNVSQDSKAIQWRMERNTPDVPSPLIHGGLVYLCRENGVLICLDAKTGEQYYSERTHIGRHRASPVYANGHIYLTARQGMVTVLKAGKKFEMVSQNDMKVPITASLAISEGRIYIRTFESLYAIENLKPKTGAGRAK